MPVSLHVHTWKQISWKKKRFGANTHRIRLDRRGNSWQTEISAVGHYLPCSLYLYVMLARIRDPTTWPLSSVWVGISFLSNQVLYINPKTLSQQLFTAMTSFYHAQCINNNYSVIRDIIGFWKHYLFINSNLDYAPDSFLLIPTPIQFAQVPIVLRCRGKWTNLFIVVN